MRRHPPTLSQLVWHWLAPRWMKKLRAKMHTWKIKRYKVKKVKQAKLVTERDYWIEFNIIIKDKDQPQNVGPFNIVIPAKGIYFAKRNLRHHLKNNLDIEVVHFEHFEEIPEDSPTN